ncbi:hypothetical protein C8J57DRAFT_1233492 [Mycena rebaudengoi]|nr:hypothetical protein C8J57DRAFT_1233492 [Mycena rebaudengoi]
MQVSVNLTNPFDTIKYSIGAEIDGVKITDNGGHQSGAGMIGGYAWRPWRAVSQAQQFIKIESTQHSEDMNFIQRNRQKGILGLSVPMRVRQNKQAARVGTVGAASEQVNHCSPMTVVTRPSGPSIAGLFYARVGKLRRSGYTINSLEPRLPQRIRCPGERGRRREREEKEKTTNPPTAIELLPALEWYWSSPAKHFTYKYYPLIINVL